MDEKGKGIISYIFGWIGGLIVLLAFKDNNKRTTMHACQSIVVSVGVVVINLVYGFLPFSIPFFSTVLWGLQVAIIVTGIVKVVNGSDPEIPVVGSIAKSIFAKKIDEAPDVVAPSNPQETSTSVEEAKKETKAKDDTTK